ncbi:hypothetical protein GUJ93_ZPchr0012g20151 [Zizania palustris]|uniref:DUF7597 domain-containing protein n=1 Tax=Zizania palustris TaxID=103762 RepID=A0A8J6BVQ5_ZIZPA|nr:hypothetical protein GUJ93_ZPchr0012g20151 [Zizania palustris]
MITDGGGELQKWWNVISLSGQQVKKHEDMAILICEDNFDALERHEFLQLVHHYITQVMRLQVLRTLTAWLTVRKGFACHPNPLFRTLFRLPKLHVTVDKLSAAEPVGSHIVPAPKTDHVDDAAA